MFVFTIGDIISLVIVLAVALGASVMYIADKFRK